MRKGDVTCAFVLEEDVARMAFSAVAGYGKCSFSIVAGAAGPASLHNFHADVVAVALFLKEFRMTLITIGAMFYMTENNSTDGFGLYVDFVYNAPPASHASYLFHTNSVQDGR